MLNYILLLLRNPTDSRLLFLLHKGAGRGCPVEERACWDRPGKEDEDVDDHDVNEEEEGQTLQDQPLDGDDGPPPRPLGDVGHMGHPPHLLLLPSELSIMF